MKEPIEISEAIRAGKSKLLKQELRLLIPTWNSGVYTKSKTLPKCGHGVVNPIGTEPNHILPPLDEYQYGIRQHFLEWIIPLEEERSPTVSYLEAISSRGTTAVRTYHEDGSFDDTDTEVVTAEGKMTTFFELPDDEQAEILAMFETNLREYEESTRKSDNGLIEVD